MSLELLNNFGYRSIWTHLFERPFKLDYVDAGGTRTRYIEAGQKGRPVVLMLHGTAGSLENFTANIGPLSEHFHCFAIDMIGCGFTDKPDVDYTIEFYADHIHRFMDAVGIDKATIIGVSMGSWIATRFTLKYPHRSEGICMLAPAGLNEHAETKKAIVKVRGSAAEKPTWESMQTVFKRLVLEDRNILPDMKAVRLHVYSMPGFPTAMQHVLSVLRPEAWEANRNKPHEYESLQVPVLVICSVDDPNQVYVKSARDVAALVPRSRIVDMPNVAHWPQFEDPVRFNQVFIEFMNERDTITSRQARS